MKKSQVNLAQCVKSLLQMIDDKIMWKQSLTEDDKDFLEQMRQCAEAK